MDGSVSWPSASQQVSDAVVALALVSVVNVDFWPQVLHAVNLH
jgi:hypothetical protein